MSGWNNRSDSGIIGADAARRALSGEPAGAYLFCGPEPYYNELYGMRVAKSAADPGNSFNFAVFPGSDMNFEALREFTQSLPVMGEKVCAVVRDLNLLKLDKDDSQFFFDTLKNLPDTCVVVIIYTGINPEDGESKDKQAWNAMFGKFSDYGRVFRIGTSVNELASMVERGAKKNGCSISRENALLLVNSVGTDLNTVLNEMYKLCALADGEITADMINDERGVCVKKLDARVFDLFDMINSGRKLDDAYALLRDLFELGEEPQKICAILLNSYVDLYRGALCRKRRSTTEMTNAFEYKNKQFLLDKAMNSRFTLPQIRKMLDICRRTDVRMKSTALDAQSEIVECVVLLREAAQS